ncbi:AP2 domain-containing protein [Hugenholtzia roseola]|uniref:AP2 domain-containing protein n=1 Tax=Hugenholtzia roseola TaxID=1002 RepID=UPI0004242520|nr:AP2 domain-containing protein [Hugenholtzia roseola]
MHLPLTNSTQKVKICREGFLFLKTKALTEGWRLHSAGYAVLQFVKNSKVETLYLHKILAKEFVKKPPVSQRLFVRMLNSNKLDCRIENLEWATMSDLRRHQNVHQTQNTTTYRGVSKDGSRFRAVLYDKGKRIYLGLYDTPEAAAQAYNLESLRRFGITNSLNHIQNTPTEAAPNPLTILAVAKSLLEN